MHSAPARNALRPFAVATTSRRFALDMRVRHLVAAAAPHLGDAAEELSRNLAQWDAADLTVENVVRAVEHRRRHFGLIVSDEAVVACAIAMVDADAGPSPALVTRAREALLEAADRAWDMAKDEGVYDAHPEAR